MSTMNTPASQHAAAHVWLQDTPNSWAVLPLVGNYFILDPGSVPPVRATQSPRVKQGQVLLGRYQRDGEPERWVLKAAPRTAITVGGRRLYFGIRVLADRDEIVLGGRVRLYFTTERLPRIEPFPGSAHPTFCARCKQRIEKGTLAVRCPNPECNYWCEQTEARPCWTYGPTCPMCSQPTKLEGATFRWSPEGL